MAVADQGQRLLYILVDASIDFGHSTTVLDTSDLGTRVVHIGDSHILVGSGTIVVEREDVDQHEMGIRTAQQGLALTLLERGGDRTAGLLDTLERRVGCRGHGIGRFPVALRRLVIGLGRVFPAIQLVYKLLGIGILELVDIVRQVFTKQVEVVVRISRDQEALHLLLAVDGGTVVWHLVQKVIARCEHHATHSHRNGSII